MSINIFTNTYNKKANQDNDLQKKEFLSPFATSIFSLISNCIEKADTSGDGVLSKEEISIFMSSGYNEIMSDFQKEFDASSEVDTSVIGQLTNMIKTMLSSYDESKENISTLEEMSKDDFIKKASDAQENKDASMFWQFIGMNDTESIFNNIDKDKDGILSKEELEKLSTLDNDKKSISLKDLGNFFKSENENKEKIQTEKQQATPQTINNASTSRTSSGSVSSSPSIATSATKTKGEKRTIDVIDSEIKEQDSLKNETQSKANAAILEQDELISNTLAQSDLSEKFKEEYNSQNEAYSEKIKEKDTKIKDEKSHLQDYNAEVSSLGSAINNIDTQIQSMEAKKSELNSSENAEKINDYTTKINNLKSKKQEYQKKQEETKAKIKETEEQISKLENEKKDLTAEKDNILNTLMEQHTDEKDKIQTLKEQIKTFEENKKNIEADLQKALNKIDTDIQALKTERAEVAQKEETNNILNENKVVADNAPEEVKDDISTYTIEDWKKLGYDENFGNNLGDEARTVATKMGNAGSKGNCLGGVKRAFIAATGNSPFGNPEEGITVASKCITVMEENENFKEITGLSKTDLQYLPAGAVIVWSSSTTGDSAASKYGHISISLGDGNEASDRLHAQYYSVGENGKPRVFIPV